MKKLLITLVSVLSVAGAVLSTPAFANETEQDGVASNHAIYPADFNLTQTGAGEIILALPEFKAFVKSVRGTSDQKAQAQVSVEKNVEEIQNMKFWRVHGFVMRGDTPVQWVTFRVRLDGKEVDVLDPAVGEMITLQEWRQHLVGDNAPQE